ncbi:MAG: hypothetical protein JST00_03200 [Deltaproteobacteria bacterium]|nr:hypothetical protein [Deltaproteobacteria bacterium]
MGSVGRVARALACLVLPAVVIFSCTSSNPEAGGGSSGSTNTITGPCNTPNEGCSCTSPGETVDCGSVKEQSADGYVSCSMGKRTCAADGRWGACNGTHITTKTMPAAGDIHAAAFTQGPCPLTGPLSNVCDPYCNQAIDDGGLTIPGASATTGCSYYSPADANASYLAINGGWQGIRGGAAAQAGACTTGLTDSCGHDSWCASGTGCVFFNPGEKNTNCGGLNWDLTFATPCDNAGSQDIKICNRGNSATPAAGTYWGVAMAASIQGQPTNVSMCIANPSLVRGYCSIDFATTTIPPGDCISRPLATLCPGANFSSTGFGSDRTTIQWNMPDWPNANCGNRARIAGECIDRNNFTTYEQSAALACAGVNCGPPGGGVNLDTTANGDSLCPPGPNVHNGLEVAGGVNCATDPAGPRVVCQQDFRCQLSGPSAGSCLWNGGEGYYDSTLPAGTVDLTVGAACEASGAETVPVCNRGNATLAAGTAVDLYFSAGIAPNSCVPSGAVGCTANAPAGGLAPGKCMNIACAIPGNKYAIVASAGETAGRCDNNQSFAKTSGAPGCAGCTKCDTRVTGRVFDPSGAGGGTNNLGLAGITVFQPSGALVNFGAAPLGPGVTCDTCASVDSPRTTYTVTDKNGDFTLRNVTPSPNTRIVVQSGRWRREIVTSVSACAANAPAAGTFRMPRNRTDGNGGVADIPKMAIVTGNQESLVCMFRKMGVAATEIGPRTGVADPYRIQLYRDNGMTSTPAPPNAFTGLFNSSAVMNEYDAIIIECNGDSSIRTSAAQRTNMKNYTDAGGRLFGNHYGTGHFLSPPEIPPAETWGGSGGGSASVGRIQTGTPYQDLFADWNDQFGGSGYGARWLKVDVPRWKLANAIPANTVQWVRGLESAGQANGSWGAGAPMGAPPPATGDKTLSYSLETPYAGTCGGGGTGRIIHNEMHVAPNRSNNLGGNVASDCNLTPVLTPEEKALEYQLFQLTACQLGGAPPPPPPPPLAPTVYYRDFEGICGAGEFPEWQFFYWQSVTPPGSSITFRAATADTQAALPPSPPGPAPTTVAAGTATGASVVSPSWASDANTIAYHLANEPSAAAGTKSKRWLRVFFQFNPIGTVSPVLSAWRQDYSCKPAE